MQSCNAPRHGPNHPWSGRSLGRKILNLPLSPAHYTGHIQVDHAAVIHMGGRIYDPELGRFMQADPIVQDPRDAQSLNRYSYVYNNPLSYTDPTGYAADCKNKECPATVYQQEQDAAKAEKTRGSSKTQEVSKSNQSADLQNSAKVANGQISTLNLTQDEYLAAVKDGLWKDAPVNPGYKNDSEVYDAADGINARQAFGLNDVVADSDVIKFVSGIAKATAKAQISVEGEKYITFGRNKSGEVVVLSIGIVSGQGGSFAIPEGTIAAAHVHYKGLIQNRPGPGDHSAVKGGRSMFMINAKGEVFEVGRVGGVGGEYDYRRINRESVGLWKELKGAN